LLFCLLHVLPEDKEAAIYVMITDVPPVEHGKQNLKFRMLCTGNGRRANAIPREWPLPEGLEEAEQQK
jgi:hypothetical protein